MVYNGCKVIFICKTCLDKGVLENYHVSASFFISKSAKADIFSTFSHNQYQKIRSSIISMVLATDMAVHFGDIARLKSVISSPSLYIYSP
jgi:hypothetical protein